MAPVNARTLICALTLCACGGAPPTSSTTPGDGPEDVALDPSARLPSTSVARAVVGDEVVYVGSGAAVEAVDLGTGQTRARHEDLGAPFALTLTGGELLCHRDHAAQWVDLGTGTIRRLTLPLPGADGWRATSARQSLARAQVFYVAFEAPEVVEGGDLACCGGGEVRTVAPALHVQLELDFAEGRARTVAPGSMQTADAADSAPPFTVDELAGLDLLDVAPGRPRVGMVFRPEPAHRLGFAATEASGARRELVVYVRGDGDAPTPRATGIFLPLHHAGPNGESVFGNPTGPSAPGQLTMYRVPGYVFRRDWTDDAYLVSRCGLVHTAAPLECEGWSIDREGAARPLAAELVGTNGVVSSAPAVVAGDVVLSVEAATDGPTIRTTVLQARSRTTGQELWNRELSRTELLLDVDPRPSRHPVAE